MTVYNEFERMWKKVVSVQSEILHQNYLGRIKENYEKSQSGWCHGQDSNWGFLTPLNNLFSNKVMSCHVKNSYFVNEYIQDARQI